MLKLSWWCGGCISFFVMMIPEGFLWNSGLHKPNKWYIVSLLTYALRKKIIRLSNSDVAPYSNSLIENWRHLCTSGETTKIRRFSESNGGYQTKLTEEQVGGARAVEWRIRFKLSYTARLGRNCIQLNGKLSCHIDTPERVKLYALVNQNLYCHKVSYGPNFLKSNLYMYSLFHGCLHPCDCTKL